MPWQVAFFAEFEAEFDAFPEAVQDAILARAGLLEREGPQLGRPYVDTLKGSRFANMKELRCDAAGGVWRIAFAFNPGRTAILLVAGNKAGVNERRFYSDLIARAEARFARHLETKGK
jgi:hypothetical protein